MSMERESLKNRLELYRPASPDPDLPDVESLREELSRSADLREQMLQINAFDKWAGKVIRDVPVPAGLEQRILNRLGKQAGPSAKSVAQPPAKPASRMMLLVSSFASLAAVVLVTFVLWPTSRVISDDELMVEAKQVFERVKNSTTFHSTAAVQENGWPSDIDRKFLAGEGVEKFFDRKVKVYQLSRENRQIVMLILPRTILGADGNRPRSLPESGIPEGDGVSVHIQPNRDDDNIIVFISENPDDFQAVRIAVPLT